MNATCTSVTVAARLLPLRMKIGTPAQRAILDREARGDVGFDARVRRDPCFAAVSAILPEHHVGRAQGPDRAEQRHPRAVDRDRPSAAPGAPSSSSESTWSR